MSTGKPSKKLPKEPPKKLLSGAQIRQKFIDFFSRQHGHRALASASLVPDNPTVLLTPAGMLPFVPVFLGIEPPPDPPRAVTCQKCARVSGKASDLENVGRTPRHHTFFEMLGNFSFGDYFKAEAIPWAWAFVTQELGLSPEHLWVSVLKTDRLFDEEAFLLWRDTVGVPEERILFCGEKDNFWGPPGPTGPCGPCSEIHYDREPGGPSPRENPALLETDRFVEIWNLVFMELFQDAGGKRTPLEKKNIDTGMGLERITMVVQGKTNTFETDLLLPIVSEAARLSGIPYGKAPETDVALRIVADHARFAAFALGDGVTPSNEGRGYILRMILRRAVRYGKKCLGFDRPFLHHLMATVRDLYQETYPTLKSRFSVISDNVRGEEARFLETLERGSLLLSETLATLKGSGKTVIPGEDLFKLYDTYGFPAELTRDMAEEEGLAVDMDGFEKAMAGQREKARKARKGEAIVADQVYARILEAAGPTAFLGYATLGATATVRALVLDGQPVEEVGGTNQPFEVILDRTPFYAESGGQVGDRGTFSREEGPHGLTVVIQDTVKVGDLIVHRCLFDNGGQIRVGETLTAQVEPVYRQLAAIHHSATHLLNAALTKVLGEQVAQAGSHVSPEGARFDFTLNRGMTPEEIRQVEATINRWIRENIPRHVDEMLLEEAKASGAVAMFGEKYGETVRVISYGSRSRELCGGTHVSHLGEIGLVKILSEGAIASGTRRIELVAGEAAYKAFRRTEDDLREAANLLKTSVQEVPQRIGRLVEDLKARERELAEVEAALAAAEIDRWLDEAGVSPDKPCVIFKAFVGAAAKKPEFLKVLAEQVSTRCPSHLIVLGTDAEGKAAFVCSVSEDRVKQGFKAGDLVKKAATLCGGGGGGAPRFAQAGGKDGARVAEAIEAVWQEVLRQLEGSRTF